MSPEQWAGCDAARVRGWIEDATEGSISVADARPDNLIAAAQALGMSPADLRLWVYDLPKADWTVDGLACFAWRHGLARIPDEAA